MVRAACSLPPRALAAVAALLALAGLPALAQEEADAAPRAWLGVRMEPGPGGEVVVAALLSGSPAEQALREGDVLLRAGDVAIHTPSDLVGAVAALSPGVTVALAVRRAGEEQLVRVVLAPHPGEEALARRQHLGKRAAELTGLVGLGASAPPTLAAVRGDVVVLEFFAGWCGACRALSPQLSRWQERLGPRGLSTIGVTSDPPEEAGRTVGEWGIKYPVGSGTELPYLVPALPTTFIIDRKGVIREVFVGTFGARREQVERLLLALLAEKA